MTKDKIIIIGAGVTGLSAGLALKAKGYDVLLLEQNKTVGGRLATGKLGKGQADLGAQSFTAKNNVFVALKNDLLDKGVIREWYRGLPAPHEAANTGLYPRYCGAKSMSSIAQAIAENLVIKTGVEVTKITHSDEGWHIEAGRDKFEADAVILTAPVPQSLELLENGKVELDKELASDLVGLTYHSCLALMARFEKEVNLPEPGTLHLTEGIVEWISDNQQKGISAAPVVTLQCNYRYSAENFDADDKQIIAEVLKSVKKWLPHNPVETKIHRWHYSKPRTVASRPCFAANDPGPLVFAGDAFVDGRIEGAYLSGYAAAAALSELLESEPSAAQAG